MVGGSAFDRRRVTAGRPLGAVSGLTVSSKAVLVRKNAHPTLSTPTPRPTPVALVLLPGLAGHAAEFAAQVDHLGGSRPVLPLEVDVEGDLSVAALADRVVDLVREAGLDRFVILGHSVCGMVALHVAATKPSGLAGVVVLDSAVLLPAVARVALRLPLLLLRTPLARPLLRRFFDATFAAADDEAFRAEVRERLATTPLRAQRALTQMNFTYDSGRALRVAEVPALVVRANIPVDLERLPAHVRRATVADVGHWPHVHASEAVNELLDDFLADVDGQAGVSLAS